MIAALRAAIIFWVLCLNLLGYSYKSQKIGDDAKRRHQFFGFNIKESPKLCLESS